MNFINKMSQNKIEYFTKFCQGEEKRVLYNNTNIEKFILQYEIVFAKYSMNFR